MVNDVDGGLLGQNAAILNGDRMMDVRERDGVDGGAVGAAVLGPNPI